MWRRRLPGGPRGNGSVARKKKTEKIVFLLSILEDSDAPLGSESSDMGGPRMNFESN